MDLKICLLLLLTMTVSVSNKQGKGCKMSKLLKMRFTCLCAKPAPSNTQIYGFVISIRSPSF